jgi:lipid II:glycine glycyltransferase (peptidoglycan interpeptide bridge formation enzyme)
MTKEWEIYNGSPEDWNNLIAKFQGQFRQLYQWGDYKSELGWHVSRVVMHENKEIVSCAQILYRTKYFFCYAYVPGGINGDFAHISYDLGSLIKRISNKPYVYIRSDFTQTNNSMIQSLLMQGDWSRPSYSMHPGKFFVLDLNLSNEELLKLAKQKWRYHHTRSQKKKCIFIQENKAEYFIEIEKELADLRDHRNLFNEREVKPLIKKLGKKLFVFVSKDLNGNLLALRSIVLVGDTAWHLSSSVNARGRDQLSGYSLLMHTIDECRKMGIKNYNLGGINLERFPGPYRFKMGIAREETLIETLGEWEFSQPKLIKNVINFLIKTYMHSSSSFSKLFRNL